MFENIQDDKAVSTKTSAADKQPNAFQQAAYELPVNGQVEPDEQQVLFARADFQELVQPKQMVQDNVDGSERIRLLTEDVKKGAWSENGKKILAQIFKEARENLPAADSKDMIGELQVATVREINRQLINEDSKYTLQLVASNSKDAAGEIISTRFSALIMGGDIDQKKNIDALKQGDDTATCQTLGVIDWQELDQTFEKYKTERLDILKQEASNNKWTDKSKKAWTELFTAIENRPGTNALKIKDDLTAITSDISKSLKLAGSTNRVGLAAGLSPTGNEVEFYVLLNNDKVTAEQNAEAIRQGIQKDTVLQAGSILKDANGNARKKDDLLRGHQLAEESSKGAWSARTQDTWRRVFNTTYTQLNGQPDFTPAVMKASLEKYANAINRYAELKGSDTRANVLSVVEGDQTNFFIQLQTKKNGEKLKADNEESLKKGRNTPTSVKAGSMKTEQPKKPPGQDKLA